MTKRATTTRKPRKPEPDRYPIFDESDRAAIEHGCWFDAKAGEHVCRFLEEFCRQSKDPFAGQPIELMPWQRQFLMRLYGWKRADGTRRYRNAYLEIPKKNGKSTLMSGLALYHLMADGEGGAECFIGAVSRKQSKIVFGEAIRMVAQSPDLKARLQVFKSTNRIVHEGSFSSLEALSSDVEDKDGANASFMIFDEIHRYKDTALWDVFEYAGKARRQPLRIAITTAGEAPEGLWHELRVHSEAVAKGKRADWEHLGVVYRADEEDDPASPETWRKANPSLGYTVKEADIAAAYRLAVEIPRKMPEFLRMNIGLVRKTVETFIDLYAWDKCKRPIDFSALRGQRCWGGLDLSTTTDLAALALLFEDWTVLIRAWLPAEPSLAEREKRDHATYRAFAEGGYLEVTPGAVIDYGWIRAAVKAEGELYNIESINLDPFNATHLALQLRDEDGFDVQFLRQGFLSLNEPTKELEKAVISHRLRHSGNPLLRWTVGNAAVIKDPAGNIKLCKKRSTGRIDPVAALVNALAARMASANGEIEERSAYDDPNYKPLILSF